MEALKAIEIAIRNLAQRIRDLENREVKLQAWQTPTLAGLWTNLGAPNATVQYWKDPYGIVHLKGTVTGGAFPSEIMTLPAGYRPDATLVWLVPDTAVITVESDGSVNAVTGTATVALDAVSFRAYS